MNNRAKRKYQPRDLKNRRHAMKSFQSGDAFIHFEATDIITNRQTLVFVNSLGTDFRIWRKVVRELGTEFNIVLHDKRGHGLSTLGTVPHKIETYAADLAALLGHLNVKRAIAVGLSVGGLIVQSLFHARPDLVSKLVISNSAVKIGNEQSWEQRISAVQSGGIESLADGIMKMWFAPEFHRNAPDQLSLYRTMLARTNPAGYIACCEALRDADFTAQAAHINVPTLFIAGEHDGSTPAALVQASAQLVPGSRFEVLEGVAHIPCVEKQLEYAKLLRTFAN
jgi:3-oxoadipate enol-lactonase